jgi:hypothetical protein
LLQTAIQHRKHYGKIDTGSELCNSSLGERLGGWSGWINVLTAADASARWRSRVGCALIQRWANSSTGILLVSSPRVPPPALLKLLTELRVSDAISMQP